MSLLQNSNLGQNSRSCHCGQTFANRLLEGVCRLAKVCPHCQNHQILPPKRILQEALTIGARGSLLSQAQVREVEREMSVFHPHISFLPTWVVTTGDQDQTTSLRRLEKTDFFTKEIDEGLLKGNFRIGVHAAKDLPEPLTPGLKMVALTKGVDSRDSLVLRAGEAIETLSRGSRIGTSSERRQKAIEALCPGCVVVDIRGTIEKRLQYLFSHAVDGVVIAEAALIRLQLTHLTRVFLEGPVAPLQGRLAVVAREEDAEMATMFRCIDA